ncbi:MAG TPA: VWA domain-containing protein [Acidobacteriaceae bacterium]|jgi:VWFA-related protein|nr:VWA domain-containing protein [Acidobacteriaceae bacterium]
MVGLGRAVLVGVVVAAALAGLARLGVGRVEAESRTAMSAGQADEPRISAPTLKAYSRETVVDVTVTDKDGKPVHGLTKADFTIKEDGKVKAIRGFEEFGKAAPAAAKELPKLPPNVYTNLQPPPASSAVNILLLDFVNSAPDAEILPACKTPLLDITDAFQMQHQMKEESIKYLREMPEGTRVAILGITWSGSLRILQGVTTDRALLIAAVNTLAPNAEIIPRGTKIAMAAESLNQLASVAAQIKGRKNLVWFSYGLSANPRYPGVDPSIVQAISKLTQVQVAVNPIGARALYCMDTDKNPTLLNETAIELLHNEQVAETGGGVAYHDNNDLEAGVVKAIENGTHYYTLTYEPPGTEYDGRHHSIHVALTEDHPGVHLVYRDEYYAENPTAAKSRLSLAAEAPPTEAGNMQAAMGRAMPALQQILFDVGVESSTEVVKTTDPQGTILGTLDPVVKVKLKDTPLTRYDFNYAIPARQIAFTNGPDGTHNGSLELDIAVYDADAKLVTGLSQTVKMPLSDDKYRQFIQGPFRISQQIDLPAGQLFVRIGILDRTTNKVGTLEIPLTVVKASGVVTAGR